MANEQQCGFGVKAAAMDATAEREESLSDSDLAAMDEHRLYAKSNIKYPRCA
jgi:hypothetical protein